MLESTDGTDTTKVTNTQAKRAPRFVFEAVQASSAQRRLAENVAEGTTGIARQYLGGTIPWFTKLIQAAQDPNLSDAQLIALLEAKASNVADELLPLLDDASLAASMEANMGAAVVNGAVSGWLARQKKGGRP